MITVIAPGRIPRLGDLPGDSTVWTHRFACPIEAARLCSGTFRNGASHAV